MTLSEAYRHLKKHFGTHGAAAEYLGFAGQHYDALRNGRANMPQRTAEYIIMKAQALSAPEAPPPRDCAPEAHI